MKVLLQVLSNPEKRKLYDQAGEQGIKEGGSGGGGGMNPMDIFDMFFGGGGGDPFGRGGGKPVTDSTRTSRIWGGESTNSSNRSKADYDPKSPMLCRNSDPLRNSKKLKKPQYLQRGTPTNGEAQLSRKA